MQNHKGSDFFSSIDCSLILDAVEITAQQTNLRNALNRLIELIRPVYIFDNFVVFRQLSDERNLEVAYARSTGRGRSAEADISWGEQLASQVLKQKQYLYQMPDNDAENDRLKRAHILVFPLVSTNRPLGVVSLIRYGGPSFNEEAIRFAGFISHLVQWLLERDLITRQLRKLEADQKQVQLQENFINTISHELRNPLGFIKGYTTTLLRQDTHWDEKSQKEFLQIIDQETDQLEDLIENLLDSARLQSGQLILEFRPVRMDALLKNVLERFKLHNPSIETEFKFAKDVPVISGDARRLTQVFENLLGNAQKYAPGSKIIVEICTDEENLVVHVCDFGPGIPQKYLPFIFKRFFRVPEQSFDKHGTGLGLFICKQLIESHQGKISLQSVVGSGTTFSVQFPINSAQKGDKEEVNL